MFIVAALVGAVGVGGALAYTYKSFVAPNGGRVPLVKADPNVKVRPDSRSAAANDKRMQGRLGEDAGQQNTAAAARNAGRAQRQRRVRADRAACGRFPLRREAGRAGIQIAPPAQAAAAAVRSWHHAREHGATVPAAAAASGAASSRRSG